MEPRVREYAAVGKSLDLWPRAGRLVYYLENQLFRNTEFEGKSFLDVGCSNGRFSAWAGLKGAERVVGLEPMGEGSGSSNDSEHYFNQFAQQLNLKNMKIHSATLQDFDCPDDSFDIVLMHAVINHVDEQACIDLKDSEEARQSYRRVFAKLHSAMKDNGRLIIVDAPRRTLYSDLGMERSPFQKRIHFIKHQDPGTWAQLLEPVGFELDRISWLSSNRYRMLGKPFRNSMAAYVFALGFRLEMICRKPPPRKP